MLCQLSYAPGRFEKPIVSAPLGGFGRGASGNHAPMSENTIEHGDEAQAAEDELQEPPLGKGYGLDEDEARTEPIPDEVLIDEEDAG